MPLWEGYLCVFPKAYIKRSMETYKKENGKYPKVLVVSPDDFLDWKLTGTLPEAQTLGLEVITFAKGLKPGEIDLAMGIKAEKKPNKRKKK